MAPQQDQPQVKLVAASPIVKAIAGMFNCIRTVGAEEGVTALWKGLTPFLGQLTLKYALRMGSNAFFLELLRNKETGKLSNVDRLTAGLGAGVSEAVLIVTPFEVVKTRLQQQRGNTNLKYKGPIHCASTIVREEGLKAMWSGNTATVIRQGSNQMSLFWGKAVCDRMMWGKQDGDGKQLTPGQSAASGFVAACIGPTLNNPFDVVKTRMQAASRGGVVYNGFFHCLTTIAKNEGPKALWKGLTPRLARTPPGQAIVWAVSDQITGYVEKKRRAQAGLSAVV
ncbi:hypothetical protein N2152v2_008668 [Parachlorella kessleri]